MASCQHKVLELLKSAFALEKCADIDHNFFIHKDNNARLKELVNYKG